MEKKLFTPFITRGIAVPNRIIVSPMGQYSASDGMANDWHMVTYGKYAQGRPGMVIVESVAVSENGRGSWGDVGLWRDDQIEPLSKIVRFIESQRVIPAVQLFHAGRKAATQRPWEGYKPLSSLPEAKGSSPWLVVGPSALKHTAEASVPHELNHHEIESIIDDFCCAAKRAVLAGFKVLELHAAHGFLLHQFLSPLSNQREDQWGGDGIKRMAFPLEVIKRVRAVIPDDVALWLRVSATDDAEGGRNFDDTLQFVNEASNSGIDLIDCSNGGYASDRHPGVKRDYGYLVHFAAAIKKQINIPSMAVGLITDAHQAEMILQQNSADLIGIAREMINDPNWALHAREKLQGDSFSAWPPEFGWWLEKRSHTLSELKPLKNN